MMNAGVLEASTPSSPPSPSISPLEGKRRKKKKSGSKEKTSPVKEGNIVNDKSSSKGSAGNGDGINVEKHFSPKSGDDVDRAFKAYAKDNQDIEWLKSESIQDVAKSSTLPPSPSSPADSVFEEPPLSSKHDHHSKSRSRSGSRSRFSGLFKRKKQRSSSETDVNRGDDDVRRSPEDPSMRDRSRRAKSASSNRTNAIGTEQVGAVVASGTFPRKANLKRESPHHAYDSRVQPRDRLLNMTVKDAAKEHRLRRADSGGLSNRRSRQEGTGFDQSDMNYGGSMNDATYPLYPEHFSTSSLSRRLPMGGVSTAADFQQTSALVHNTPTSSPHSSIHSSTLPRLLRSVSTPYPPFGIPNSGGNGEIDNSNASSSHNLPRNASTPAFVQSAIGCSDDQLNLSQEIRILAQNQSDDIVRDALKSAQNTTKTIDNPLTNIDVESHNKGNNESGSGIDKKESKSNRRKTSLSKFLDLRQAVPSSLALTRRTSQSSDSGVTSRDTSPGTSIIRRHKRQDRDDATGGARVRNTPRSRATISQLPSSSPLQSYPSSAFNAQRRSTNPYVVSSVEIPDPSIFAAPRLYLNGTKLGGEYTQDLPSFLNSNQPPKQTDKGTGENSLCYSSPAMETSQSSSYRSYDQGFVESEVSDADVEDTGDDDNSDFSTPPEEVEPYSPLAHDSSMRFATPQVLEKLLEDTQRQIHQGRRLYPGDHREKRNEQFKPQVGTDRDIPLGVRRSNSDRENNVGTISPRRTFRKGPSLSDSARDTTKLSESVETLKEIPSLSSNDRSDTLSTAGLYRKRPQDEEFALAGSTSTLTNLDATGNSSSELSREPHRTLDRSEIPHVPRMGMTAQHRYRRTFSPVRENKPLVHTPERDLTRVPNVINRGVFPTLPPPATTSITQVAMNAQPSPIKTIPAPNTTQLPVSSLQHPVSSSIIFPLDKNGQNYGDNIPVADDTMSQRKRKLESSAAPLNLNQISHQPSFVNRLASIEPQQDSAKASSVLLGRGSLSPSEKVDHLTPIVHGSSATHETLSNKTSVDAMAPQMTSTAADVEGYQGLSDEEQIGRESSPPFFPIIHGLEIDDEREGKFKGNSLSHFLQEQSRTKWQRFRSSKKDKSGFPKRKEKSLSPTKREKSQSPTKREKSLSPTKAGRKALERQSNTGAKPISSEATVPIADSEDTGLFKEENVTRTSQKAAPEQKTLHSMSPDRQDMGMRTMVDKECQTSTWLINSFIKAKPKKVKKKAGGFMKSKSIRRRRDSAASDTYVPANLGRQRRGATQWSSLGDVRVVAAYEDRHRSESPEKKLKRSKSDRTSKRSINDGSMTGSSNQGRSRIHSVDSDPPKSKKLSLTAIILLKNKLAKVKKRKSKDRDTFDAEPEEEEPQSDVPSDTMMTIENEINLSKLEVSKETDIVDDDIFEPEFSLDYSKRQIHFEDLPPSEPMQSEEPLPPLPPQASRRMRHRRESTMRERRRKCVSYCKKFIAFLFSHIGLCSLVVAYTIMGGFIFQYIENDKDMDSRRTVTVRQSDMVGRLISLAVDFKASENSMQNLTDEVKQYVQDFREFITQKVKNEAYDGKDEGVWSFASSMLYAITVTTTIGYGHVAPKTTIGRLVTIGYAVVGIPLTLLCLTNIGDVMATGFRLLYGKVCCGVCCTLFKPRRRTLTLHPDLEKGMGIGRPVVTSNEDDSPDKSKEVIHVPTSLCLLLIAGYIIAGAMLFASWEKWDMLTGSYFCFITLSTIGFGDIVPGMDSGAWAQEEKLVLCALYLVLGLSLIAMCFNLVQEDVKAKCKWLGMKLGIVEKPKAPI